MDFISVLFLAFALGLDAFAVSLAAGAYFVKSNTRQKFRLSFHFGLFQFFMPIVGWLIGAKLIESIKDFDHWLVFIILLIIGGKMIYEGIKGTEEHIKKDISRGWSLVTLSIATSLDALAVGFGFGIMQNDILLPCIIIGIIAAIMSLIGVRLGEILSFRFSSKFSIAGGIILVLLGLKIILEHLNFL